MDVPDGLRARPLGQPAVLLLSPPTPLPPPPPQPLPASGCPLGLSEGLLARVCAARSAHLARVLARVQGWVRR